MMQDTVLNMCKSSVTEFKDFILKFIPDETIITSTASVTNIFPPRKADEIEDEDDTIVIDCDDLPEAKMRKEEIMK
jgi:hypothetical protein